MLSLDISDITLITVKGINYRFIISDINKSSAIHSLENYVLGIRGFIQNAFQTNQR